MQLISAEVTVAEDFSCKLDFFAPQLWVCEFCGGENVVDGVVATVYMGQRAGVRSDDLYQPKGHDDDYENLENSLVVFCVDISGSMSVTTEVRGTWRRRAKGSLTAAKHQLNAKRNKKLPKIAELKVKRKKYILENSLTQAKI